MNSQIWLAFCQQLEAVAAQLSPPLLIKFQGVHSDEGPDSGYWLEAMFFPNKPDNYALQNDDASDYSGFCQIGVCYRPGADGTEGILQGLQLSEFVCNAFKKGTRIGPALVYEQPGESATPLITAGKITHIITVYYLASGVK